jgi:hypothetical protein
MGWLPVRLTSNPTVSNALSSRWAAGDKEDARQTEGRRRQGVYNLAVNRCGGANLFSIRSLWKKSLDGGGTPPPTYPPDPTIQRADVDTPTQSEQNFVSDPDRVMGSSPLCEILMVM